MLFETVLTRLLVALALSFFIGYERSKINRAAGLRTHILVCVASALIMVTSIHLNNTLGNVDISRMGSQVISGIGFLGAGTIIHSKFTVRGLTTAASLWGIGAIGLATGAGFYEGAVLTTLLFWFSLRILSIFENRILSKNGRSKVFIKVKGSLERVDRIKEIAIKHKVTVEDWELLGNDEQHYYYVRMKFRYSLRESSHLVFQTMLFALSSEPWVAMIRVLGDDAHQFDFETIDEEYED